MLKWLKRLGRDEDGAVTVDWVVLTAAMVGFGAIIVLGIRDAATDPADSVSATLTDYEIQ